MMSDQGLIHNASFREEAPTGGHSIDILKYVDQLESRVIEQSQLIKLLNDKIARFESGQAVVGAKSYAQATAVYGNKVTQAVTASTATPSAASKTPSHPQSGFGRRSPAMSFIGSRKADISTVPTIRYCQLFATRLHPDTSSKKLGEYLLENLENLSSVKCSKMKTKHSSYASFHVVVPEANKSLVCCGDAWPEGALVKLFTGKLLDNFVMETFSSDSSKNGPDLSSKTCNKGSTQSSNSNAAVPATAGEERSSVPDKDVRMKPNSSLTDVPPMAPALHSKNLRPKKPLKPS